MQSSAGWALLVAAGIGRLAAAFLNVQTQLGGSSAGSGGCRLGAQGGGLLAHKRRPVVLLSRAQSGAGSSDDEMGLERGVEMGLERGLEVGRGDDDMECGSEEDELAAESTLCIGKGVVSLEDQQDSLFWEAEMAGMMRSLQLTAALDDRGRGGPLEEDRIGTIEQAEKLMSSRLAEEGRWGRAGGIECRPRYAGLEGEEQWAQPSSLHSGLPKDGGVEGLQETTAYLASLDDEEFGAGFTDGMGGGMPLDAQRLAGGARFSGQEQPNSMHGWPFVDYLSPSGVDTLPFSLSPQHPLDLPEGEGHVAAFAVSSEERPSKRRMAESSEDCAPMAAGLLAFTASMAGVDSEVHPPLTGSGQTNRRIRVKVRHERAIRGFDSTGETIFFLA